MWASVKQWVSQHRRVVACAAVGGGLVGGYALYRHLRPVIDDLRDSLRMMQEMEQRVRDEQIGQLHERLSRAFAQTCEASHLALVHMVLEIRARLDDMFQIDAMRQALRSRSKGAEGASAPADEFKCAVLARTFALLYSLSLAAVMLRVQLCIAARYSSTEGGPEQDRTNAAFLQIAQHLVHDGLSAIAAAASQTVATMTSSYAIKSPVTPADIASLVERIRQRMDDELVMHRAQFMMPAMDRDEEGVTTRLLEMRAEMEQLVNSDSMALVLRASLQTTFTTLDDAHVMSEGDKDEVAFGRILPKFARVFDVDLPKTIGDAKASALLRTIIDQPELKDFSAIVFFPVDHPGQHEFQAQRPPTSL
ncbi:unnamed protein product (mitochondrion) [Plasmodiophora brassicae]|uniref:Peroxin-3 n=1 Tax=Plasmodiophora brassicae TaxID=37360 RepID=A0A0G4IP65_PLABS|nr:hypothetical protein PBRA_005645 [Plasmodiophora brassicae]SPR01022.1 unnamed protein product [Plasmodiophora brassicae]